uniref:Guanylate cyclase domain-containing protein n=1 Tax=Timema douglasi TaxID=61478 RepID=A0A7R8Z9C1_TIMDO|nr:unnamed protein product [Timema douglasi]
MKSLRIHVSSAAQQILSRFCTFQLELRGQVELKGKGNVTTYWLLGCTEPDPRPPTPRPCSDTTDTNPYPLLFPTTSKTHTHTHTCQRDSEEVGQSSVPGEDCDDTREEADTRQQI